MIVPACARKAKIIMEIKSILMICHGNVCRSPMAEGLFRHKHPYLTVTSAGLTALVDEPADPFAQSVMQRRGLDIAQHRARQITEPMVRAHDLIFVMTQEQLLMVERQFFISKGKVFLLGHWEEVEIDDPFTQPEAVFENTYRQIERAWKGWEGRI